LASPSILMQKRGKCEFYEAGYFGFGRWREPGSLQDVSLYVYSPGDIIVGRGRCGLVDSLLMKLGVSKNARMPAWSRRGGREEKEEAKVRK
jgi:hypothetical protein